MAELLDGPFVGVQLPATALASPEGWYAAGEILRVAELADKPVFIHPGPATAEGCGAVVVGAVVGYVAQLQAAWWAWHAFDGRAQFPRLRLVFAPAPDSRPSTTSVWRRAAGSWTVDPDVFVDTSSYGAQGLDALVRALGSTSSCWAATGPTPSPSRRSSARPRRRRSASTTRAGRWVDAPPDLVTETRRPPQIMEAVA